MSYIDIAKKRCAQLQCSEHVTILSIETSCDETAAAIVRDGRVVLSNSVYTQIPLHRKFGGVVPELASRNHVDQIAIVVEQALEDANLCYADIDAIAVTYGPGLVGALLVGVSFAKALALALNIQLIGTHHLMGHIAANYLTYPDLEPPFCCLIASGGHSDIVEVKDYVTFERLGGTRDDAAGEAFDKVARILGLPYPGGPELEKLAKQGDPKAIKFHSSFNESDGYDMSFSGIKTAVINHVHNHPQVSKADVAASFQYSVNTILSDKAVHAAKHTLALAGGVSANRNLRDMLQRKCDKKGLRFCCPDFLYCTDNASMIGSAGYYLLKAGRISDLNLNAVPYLEL
ncbi:MAG: tRNA (adenosine(37)-N6)-threonylcarbamoyltransferase complex transferase subunit TsaD [Eubacteriales bacterium]|nr:tRNA (adenosine(37)-N6)-threonylcarbamoyltransferase complex transferase subunit TsaD [Eubacteriales bacterium]